MSYVLIIGAKSDIVKATAKNSEELEEFAKDIIVRTQRRIKLLELDTLVKKMSI